MGLGFGNRDRSIAILSAFAVSIFVFVPILERALNIEFQQQSSTACPESGASKSNDWEIPELPIMQSKSRGFRPLYIYSKVPYEHRDQYSQEKQDSLIMALMKANDAHYDKKDANTVAVAGEENKRPTAPFFVDLAANDPTVLSNSFLLEQNGWNGLCIEPNPGYWYRLASLRTCTIIGAFVGGIPEEDGKEIQVNLAKWKKGGIVGAGMDNSVATEKRNIVSLLTIFRETNVPKVIDYFSLDVEGAESLVMQNFPWDEYSFKFISIERPKDDLKMMLQVNGYKLARTISGYDETLWVNEKLVKLSEKEVDDVSKSLGIPSY